LLLVNEVKADIPETKKHKNVEGKIWQVIQDSGSRSGPHPHWFGSSHPDLDPIYDKKLVPDQDLPWNQCGSTTLLSNQNNVTPRNMGLELTIFTVPVPFPTFEKLWFGFWLLKSCGSGSYVWKVTIPVPYVDHKKQ
jgi:hypothetical protein